MAQGFITQNTMQLKTYELFISGTFHVIVLDRGWLQVTEMADKETDYYTTAGGEPHTPAQLQDAFGLLSQPSLCTVTGAPSLGSPSNGGHVPWQQLAFIPQPLWNSVDTTFFLILAIGY